MAIPEGTTPATSALWFLHPLVGQTEGRIQDRRQRPRRSSLGEKEEPTCHELRQTVSIHPPVLQKGNHEEDREIPETRVPVLPPLLLVGCVTRGVQHV